MPAIAWAKRAIRQAQNAHPFPLFTNIKLPHRLPAAEYYPLPSDRCTLPPNISSIKFVTYLLRTLKKNTDNVQ